MPLPFKSGQVLANRFLLASRAVIIQVHLTAEPLLLVERMIYQLY